MSDQPNGGRQSSASVLFHLEVDSDGRLVGSSRILLPGDSRQQQQVVPLVGERAFVDVLRRLIDTLTGASHRAGPAAGRVIGEP